MKRLGFLLLTLSMIIGLLPKAAYASEIANFNQDLTAYLDEVSATRGFEVNEDDIDQSLSAYYMTTDDFTTVDEMKEFLGEVINADLSNLDSIYETYELDQTSLTQLLSEYGEGLDDYIFVSDLDWAVAFYTDSDSGEDTTDLGIDPTAYLEMLDQLGLSEDELTALQDHYTSISDSLLSADVQSQLEDLSNRAQNLQNSLLEKVAEDPDYKPTDTEINEMVSVYDELYDIFQINVEYSLNIDGTNTPVTLAELLRMDDITTADLNLAIYNSNNELLADAVVTSDFVTSILGDLIDVTESDNSASDDDNAQTVKGGELPKTASNYLSNALLGLFVALAGILVYLKVRTGKGETFTK